MTQWQKAWTCRHKTRRSQNDKKFLKKLNHKANRQVAKALDTTFIKLNAWDVT